MMTDRREKKCILVLTILVVLVLASTQGTRSVTRDSSISNGIIIDLDENVYVSSNISLDINSVYNQLRFNISSVPSYEMDYPANLTVWFDDLSNKIFQFQGAGYGDFGRQNVFSDGQTIKELIYSNPGSSEDVQFMLPENATVTSASMKIRSVEKVLNWTDPLYLVQDINGSQVPISTLGQISADFVDIDNDGLLDLIKGGWSPIYNTSTFVYRNIGTKSQPVFQYNSTYSANISMETKANPRFVDIDDDGDYDLFIGQYNGRMSFYRNNGTKSSPIWNKEPFLESYVFGYEPCPSFVDIDDDGDKDITIGYQSHNNVLSYFRNDGNATSFKFVQGDIYAGLELDDLNFPALSDFDLDGDYDLFVGHWKQPLSVFENIGNESSPIWGPRQRILDEIDFGYYITPTFADLSGDGYDDLVIGVHNGVLNLLVRDVRYPGGIDIGFGSYTSQYDLGSNPRTDIQLDITEGIEKVIDLIPADVYDEYMAFKLFNLTITPDEIGGLVITDLHIVYDLTSVSHDISTVVNTLLDSERRMDPSNRTVEAPLILYSSSTGRVRIVESSDHYRPIEFDAIPTTHYLYEDSQVSRIIDIHRYIRYPGDFEGLSFSVLSEDDISNIFIEGNRFISVDNTQDIHFENWTGTQEIRIHTVDDLGFSATSNVISIITLPVNDPPVIYSVPKTRTLEDTTYHYQIIAKDVDSESLTFSIVQGPATMDINITGYVTWSTEQKDVGSHIIIVSVSDGEFDVEQSFQLRVMNVNDAPIFKEVPTIIVTRGVRESVDWTSFVFDEDTPPTGLVMSTETPYLSVENVHLIIAIPIHTVFSEHHVVITVTDGEFNATTEFWIYISDEVPVTLEVLPLPTIQVFRDQPFLFDVGDYIVYNGTFDDVSLLIQSDYIKTYGLTIEINIPGTATNDHFEYVMSIILGDLTIHEILKIDTIGPDVWILDIPLQRVPEDTTYRMDIEQYLSMELMVNISDLVSSSDVVVESGKYYFTVHYSLPITDVIDCTIILKNDTSLAFYIDVEIIPTNDPPVMTKEISDITIEVDGRFEIDLFKFFSDEEGDALEFRSSHDIIQITSGGQLVIEYNKEMRNERIMCTITAIEVGDSSSYAESNTFQVSFGNTEGPSGRSILWDAVTILLLASILLAAGFYYVNRNRGEHEKGI